MPHPLESSIIRILRPDGSIARTGFLVSKRLAITCAHNVEAAKAKPGDMVKFEYHLGRAEVQLAKVLENGWSAENYVAILELTEKPLKWIRPIIMQSSRAMEERSFQGLGYPDDGPVQTRWPQGNITGAGGAAMDTEPLQRTSATMSYKYWRQIFLLLITRDRRTMFGDIKVLLPFITHIGSKSICHEIYFAVRDVTTW